MIQRKAEQCAEALALVDLPAHARRAAGGGLPGCPGAPVTVDELVLEGRWLHVLEDPRGRCAAIGELRGGFRGLGGGFVLARSSRGSGVLPRAQLRVLLELICSVACAPCRTAVGLARGCCY
jgi:hypothetical protein